MTTPFVIKSKNLLDTVNNTIIRDKLLENVLKINEYRETCVYNFETSFPMLNRLIWRNWIVHERDFMLSTHGLHIMKTRYLFPNEPIQYCMLRIALRLVGCDNYELLRITYDLISCCILSVSSILAASSYQDKDLKVSCLANLNSGEACQLHVLGFDYDVNTMLQASNISSALCMGVGIGIGASSVPLLGSTTPGKIRTGFYELCQKFEHANGMTMYERKPKTAIYLNICYETCLEIFNLKIPAKSPLHNVFFGLFIPDLFLECVKQNEMWYLFSGTDKDEYGKRLEDYYGDQFVLAYDSWVAEKKYTNKIPAKELMQRIVHCQLMSGSPYIMWSDNINRYNNQAHLGVVKTSNLCAEIVNVATPKQPSSCTLISCNMATIKDHCVEMNRVYHFINKLHNCSITLDICNQFTEASNDDDKCMGECAKYAYAVGYMSCLIMNCFMGKRKYRELGISPMGLQDMAFIMNRDPIKLCSVVSESMYRGAIQASCHISQNSLILPYIRHTCVDNNNDNNDLNDKTVYGTNNIIDSNYLGSRFSIGQPQWFLRNAPVMSNWEELIKEMKLGMANSMLTAQAPTATTSLLIDNTESVLLAMDIFTLKESESGRYLSMSYGMMSKYMNDTRDISCLTLMPSVDDQVEMYAVSAPFIDQSQSVMLSIELNPQAIFDALIKTKKHKLKTAIYYFNYRQRLTTYQTVRNTNLNTFNKIGIPCEDSCAL
uniref:Rrm1 protein n=1 Tax=Fopius arisanus TaxID=64838 RepID=A0A0C9RNW4_9HYME